MKITMISIGSTGDVRPYILLGKELKSRGHEITLLCFPDFEKQVQEAGLTFRALPGDAVTLMSSVMTTATGITFLYQFKNVVEEQLDDMLASMMAACEGAEAVICTFFGSMVYSIAEKFRIPCIQTHFFPMDKSELAPMTTVPLLRMGKTFNKATYKLGYLIINSVEWKYLGNWRKKHGMRPKKITTQPDYTVNGYRIPVLYALSPMLLPRSIEWDENIHMTGFLMDRTQSDFTPSPELTAFLEAGEKPIYIGFGSMCSSDVGHMLDIVVQAVRMAGVRAIIGKGWGGADMRDALDDPNIFVADYLPHSWLFPRVAAVVHHGGAGTTAAGIMAGCPTLVIPFGGDQHFWASRVYSLGLGPKYIRREFLTSERLARSLKELVEVKSYRVAAQELGARLAMEDGVRNAADIAEREFADWKKKE